jgi:Domain of unknown function (DUF4145)
MAFTWTCPYCERDTTITNTTDTVKHYFDLENADGYRGIAVQMIVCPNPECHKFSLMAAIFSVNRLSGYQGNPIWEKENVQQRWTLIPPSAAKVFPNYVPKAIRDDYVEACLIRDLSPKASATLSRRCLQGIIRGFWGVSKSRLVDEIEEIKGKTDALTWDAIDAVRKIGNIGAHMEKDINIIVDVDPDEAQLLIELIEILVKEWYIAKHQREENLNAIIKVRDSKDAAKAAAKAPAKKPGA